MLRNFGDILTLLGERLSHETVHNPRQMEVIEKLKNSITHTTEKCWNVGFLQFIRLFHNVRLLHFLLFFPKYVVGYWRNKCSGCMTHIESRPVLPLQSNDASNFARLYLFKLKLVTYWYLALFRAHLSLYIALVWFKPKVVFILLWPWQVCHHHKCFTLLGQNFEAHGLFD